MNSNRDGIESAEAHEEVEAVEKVGEYPVPVDPMDELECESCQ